MTDEKSIYGLVGYPVEHSLSPLMHNAAFKELEVNAEYKLFPIEEKDVESFIKKLHEKNNPIFGLNITVPYKEKVIPFIDTLTPFAAKVLAVNTVVVKKDRQLVGYNTDGPGFLAHLAELGIETADKRVAVLGAGGVARAIVSVLSLIPERPQSIKIYDIDTQRGEALLFDLTQRMDTSIVSSVHSIDDLNIELADILINCTPVGMQENDPCLVDPDLINSNLFVYDVIYNPKETKLLKMAKDKGAKISNGLGMLFYQGVLGFQHWAELELDQKVKNIMREALEEGLPQ